MKSFFRFFAVMAMFFAVSTLTAESSAADFLNQARKWRSPEKAETYAVLLGSINHLRRGSEPESWPISFRIIINKDSSTGQLVVGTDEAYLLRHRSGEKYRNFATSAGKSTVKLSRSGLKASDLVLGFIFYELEKELEKDSLGAGLIPCRVLLLYSKEHNESAKVWFMENGAIPVRAEFCRSGEKKPYRTIEIVKGDKFDGLYCATRIKASGPGWRTIVDFDREKSSCGILKSKDQKVMLPLDEVYGSHRKIMETEK